MSAWTVIIASSVGTGSGARNGGDPDTEAVPQL